jgi:autotransporter translocation and assembly factor TamB
MVGDSIRIDNLGMNSGRGHLQVTGGIRLEALTRPILDLTLVATEFQALNVRNFASLDATGRLVLTGPVMTASLTGGLTANQGAFYFADLVTKRIVDIENPEDSTLLDRSVVREQRLGAGFVKRFLDSLTIRNLRVAMGESFWLRSGEANIQLDDSIIVSKQRDRFRVDGTLRALRGNYVLKIGFVVRDFIVERGTVRYFGTPDLNAELDIEARHTVRATQTTDEVPVIATITGTMLAPKLTLSSPVRPPLSETELVSYLMFGQATFGLTSTGSPQGTDQLAAVRAGMSYLSSALSSEVQRTLVADLGVPIDYLNIQTGAVGAPGTAGTSATSTQLAQVAAGWQIGRQFFVIVNADICTNAARFYPNVEYRISREFRLKASVEPTRPCNAIRTGETLSTFNKYQLGFDVLWEREQ